MNDINITNDGRMTSIIINGERISGISKATIVFEPNSPAVIQLEMVGKRVTGDSKGIVHAVREYKAWTEPEEKKLLSLYYDSRGLGIAEIARMMGRTRASVDTKLREIRRRNESKREEAKRNNVCG